MGDEAMVTEAEARWCVSADEERFYGDYESPEAALAAAADELGEDDLGDPYVAPGRTVYVARTAPFDWSDAINAEDIIERVQEAAAEHCGEAGEEWLTFLPAGAHASLERRLAAAFGEWLDEVKAGTVWGVVDVRPVVIPADAADAEGR